MSKTGKVKSYNTAKGFGFIMPSDGGPDVFVLRTDVMGEMLAAGDQVQYDEGVNDRTGKPKAVNVVGGTGGEDLGGKGFDMKGGGKDSKGGGKNGKGGGKGGKKGGIPGGFGGGAGLMGFDTGAFPPPCGAGFGLAGGFGGKGGGCRGGSKTGYIKFFNEEKGFGFIVPDEGGSDLFVHCNDIVGGSLNEGDRVTFDEGFNDRQGKPKAMNVSGGSGGERPPSKGGFGGGKGGKMVPDAYGGGGFPGGFGCGGLPPAYGGGFPGGFGCGGLPPAYGGGAPPMGGFPGYGGGGFPGGY